jgi:hypothetical protein
MRAWTGRRKRTFSLAKYTAAIAAAAAAEEEEK